MNMHGQMQGICFSGKSRLNSNEFFGHQKSQISMQYPQKPQHKKLKFWLVTYGNARWRMSR